MANELYRIPPEKYNSLGAMYKYGRQSEALAEVRRLLAEPNKLSVWDIQLLRWMEQQWSTGVVADFVPPEYPAFNEYSPLHTLAIQSRDATDYSAALRYGWQFLQYSAAGTVAFHAALSNLADIAADCGDMTFAQHAAETYLGHYQLLYSASAHLATPVGMTEPTREHAWPDGPHVTQFAIPFVAALKGIVLENPAPCWVTILEMAAYHMPNYQHERDLPGVVRALFIHYQRVGDPESAARIQRDFPDHTKGAP